MSDKKGEEAKSKKTKSVRFAANVAVNDRHASEDETDDSIDESSFDDSTHEFDSSLDVEEFKRLRTENEELQDVLHDFYHDSKMSGKNESILIGDIESHPSESISSLICRVLVNYDKLCEERRILEEEKLRLDEDKAQLTTSMTKLREQFHDAVDSNIEEIEDLNHDNENLHFQVKTLSGKNTEVVSILIKAREEYVNRLKAISELSKGCNSEKLLQRLKNDSLLANIELKEAKELVQKNEEDRRNKLKRVQSLPSTLRQDSTENSERGGILRELKTCKNLQESQRKQISKILDEKLALETQVAELKRQVVLLKASRKANVKTMSRLSQTEGIENKLIGGGKSSKTVSNADVERLTQRCKDLEQKLKKVAPGNSISESSKALSPEVDSLTRRCQDLEQKLEKVKQEKSVLVQEKTSLLLSFDANIEKKDALEAQLADLQGKVNENGNTKLAETNTVCTQTNRSVEKVEKSLSEIDGGFQAGYKGISEAKVEIEKIRVQEQDKQIAMLKRENEGAKEKLKKAEDMSQTLQNCLKELTDEKHELLDSIEELQEEKAELEEARLKLENKLGKEKREKIGLDEVSDIRNKEDKVGGSLEAYEGKLAQLDLKVVEVLELIGSEGTKNKKSKSDANENFEDMIGSLLLMVENLKTTVITFKTTYEETKSDSLRTKNEFEALNREKTELQNLSTRLRKQNEEMAVSLENSKKSQKSYELNAERLKKENVRLDRELGGARATNTGCEKSLAESRKREEGLNRQLKNVSNKRDDLQKAFDRQTKTSTEISSRLASVTKEVEAFRSKNEKLTTEIEQLREELEGTVEDRDELLELLDRIVCENGTGEEKSGLGQKVERIRERGKPEEHLPGTEVNDSGRSKPVEDEIVSSVVNNDYAAAGENELFEETVKTGKNDKDIKVLRGENQKLKEMIEQMLKDQKKMEVVLNSLSEANAEVKQGLEESLEHTEQIRLQGSESTHDENSVDSVIHFSTISDGNAELRRLHEAMVGTNEALSANLRRLHDEKTRSEELKTSFQDVSCKNAALEKKVESLSKDKERAEKDILDVKKRLKEEEKELQKAKNEKIDVDSILEEANGRVKDLRFQIDSLTEINQDLRETNEKLSGSSKEYQKKWSKLSGKFDEVEFQNEDLKKLKKRLEKELAELAKQKSGLERQLSEQGKQKTEAELELEKSKDMIASLQSEVRSCTEKMQEMEKSLETSARELTFLRDTAGRVTQLEQDAQAADALRTDMDDIQKALSERDKRVAELENDVSRLKKEIQSLQRFVKTVSQENDTLRDSLSEWEREACKIRRHVHELSQDAENHNHRSGEDKNDSKSLESDKVRSVRAFEPMQVEMDAINQHLKSLTQENQELTDKVEVLTKESAATRDRNIELEKKVSELNKLSKDGKDSRSKKKNKNEKQDEEKNSLQTKIDKLDVENKLLKDTLENTLDEEERLGEILKNLIDGKKVQRKNSGKSKKDVVSEEYEIRTEISGLVTTKPDLIRDSTEVKDEYLIVERRKYRKDLSALESSETEAETKELLYDLLEGQMNLKSYCHEVSKVFQEGRSFSSMDAIDGKNENEAKLSLDNITAELQKSTELNKHFESSLQEKDTELAKTCEEKAKLESELASIKEKCEKLQAVFRALIHAMNDKKDGEKKSGEEAEGPTRIIDYIKGIKTKYTTLVSEKENLESKVSDLQKEIEEHKARAKMGEKRSKENKKKQESVEDKNGPEDKERILNELLLSSARNKTRLLEKLQEIFDEFLKIKSKLEKELDSQGKGSNLEKIYEELAESIKHTERFIQSIAHDRPVTVVADSADGKDPNLELAKENEELIGRISAVQSSRRRESKNYKDELTKMEKNKVEAVKAEETRWKDEMEKMKGELEKKMKEKEQAATEVKKTLKQEISQLKLDIRRISDEHDVAERNARNEARSAAEKSEENIKLLKSEMEKKLAEKDSKIVEVKRKADAEKKESAQMAEKEVSQVRVSWADAEKKLRIASEGKADAVRELGRVKQEKSEEKTSSDRELQKLKMALETTQKQVTEREDGFRKEKDRLQRTIANLEGQVRNSEIAGLERTQSRIAEFQRDLDELAKQKQQLEAAKRKTEQNLGTENDRLRFEISRLQREVWELNQQRRIGVNNDAQRRPDPNIPPGERVKLVGTVRQAPIEKPRIMIPVENFPGPFPGPPGPTTGAPGLYPGDQQRRAVKVREGQTTSVNVTRVQDQGVRRSSDPREQVTKELNEHPEWKSESGASTVIQARPVQTRAQVQQLPQAPAPQQKPQPEWQPRQDNTWPNSLSNNTRHKDPYHIRVQAPSQKTGYNTEYSRQRPGHPNSKPVTRRTQGSLEADVTLSDPRRAVEVKKPPVNEKPHSTKSLRQRRPSIGSDEVFLANSNDDRSLTSHGSKTGEFWRSRSLEDLLISDDRPIRQADQHVVRGHHQKLPKNFSGPRKGDLKVSGAHGGVAPARGTGHQAVGKRVTPLKGMQYASFQSQI